LKNILTTLLISLLPLGSYADATAERGWYWYQDPIAAPQLVESKSLLPATPFKNWTEYNDAVKREFEEIQYRAIYNPTPENVQAYNTALRMIADNATRFGMLSVTKNWQDPNAGISKTAPNGAGLVGDLDNQRKQIGDIVNRYAIFYFIGKDCHYCASEANEIKRLELTYNMSARVISLDGTTLPQYPNPLPDKGISQKLGVKQAGEILAFDSTTNKTTVIGYGYIHFDQIVQRLQTLFITGTANWDQYRKQDMPVKIVGDN
jgi:conjugal transfer pilus assembly protein TraF